MYLLWVSEETRSAHAPARGLDPVRDRQSGPGLEQEMMQEGTARMRQRARGREKEKQRGGRERALDRESERKRKRGRARGREGDCKRRVVRRRSTRKRNEISCNRSKNY